jgi:DHA3 family macrolide efflux protein-like MFS transporter
MAAEVEGVSESSQPDGGEKRANFLSVLRHKGFRNLWLGQVVSQVGDYFSFLATMVVVSGFSTDVQGTTLAVSGMMLAQSLPRLLFGMLAGVFVDRWDRRRTMIASDVIRAVLTLAMIPAFMSKNLLMMYALGFALSAVTTLFRPAEQALIPRLVPKNHLTAANSLAQTSFMLSVLLGPGLAGFTLKAAGAGNEWVAFIADSASFVLSAIAIWRITVPKGEQLSPEPSVLSPDASPVRKVWDELLVGLKMLALNRSVATLTAVGAIAMLGVGAVNVLWVVFLKVKFGLEGPELGWRLGVMDIAFAVGMMVSSIVMGNFLSHLSPKWFVVGSLVGVGLSLAAYAYLPDYWSFMACSVVLGLFVAPINTGVTTMVQILVPNSQLGRVNGGMGAVMEAATLLSMSLAGAFGAALGIPTVFVLGGLICAASGLVAWALLPAVTLKDKLEETEPPTEDGPTPEDTAGPIPFPIPSEADDRLVNVHK